MAKVLPFTGITKLDIDPEQVLDSAKGQLEGVLLIGFDHEGELYVSSSYADGGMVLWLMECCRKRLMRDVEID